MNLNLEHARQMFHQEASTLLQQLEHALLDLDHTPGLAQPDQINALFRPVHTLKGSSGLFDFEEIVRFTHVVEGFLQRLRNGELAFSVERLEAMFLAHDHLQQLVEAARLGTRAHFSNELYALFQSWLVPGTSAAGADAAHPHAAATDSAAAADVGALPPLEIETSGERLSTSEYWHISIRFGQNVLREGMDPLSFIRYLGTLGRLVRVLTLYDALPPIEQMDPEACYLGVEIEFEGGPEVSKLDIEGAFDFIRESSHVRILPPRARIDAYVALIAALPNESARLGEILVQGGALTPSELKEILRIQSARAETDERKPLGELLLDEHMIQAPIVRSALEHQLTTAAQRGATPSNGTPAAAVVGNGEESATAPTAVVVLPSFPVAPSPAIKLPRPDSGDGSPLPPHGHQAAGLLAQEAAAARGASTASSEAASSPSPITATTSSPASAQAAPPPTAQAAAALATLGTPRVSDLLRVNATRLDQLINLVGELVIAGAAAQLRVEQHQPVQEAMQVVGSLIGQLGQLRDEALALRMVPISELFARFSRMVRETARGEGKQVHLELHGEETELDKAVADQLLDPLVHLVRNAIAHGVETPALRTHCGKTEFGTIRLDAYHAAGTVVVEVRDDGAGIDLTQVQARAVERGLLAADATPDAAQLTSLLFEPGFSTAPTVSELAGRGVGLDVVKRDLARIKGSIELESTPGVGTVVRLRVPLTLAIIEGFRVRVGPSDFVIPLEQVSACLDLPAHALDDGQRYLPRPHGGLPLILLREQFEIATEIPKRQTIVVVQYGQDSGGVRQVGLVVDRVLGEIQIVIKPLSRIFQGVPGISGVTLLDTGAVGLVLDIPTLLQQVSAREKEAAFRKIPPQYRQEHPGKPAAPATPDRAGPPAKTAAAQSPPRSAPPVPQKLARHGPGTTRHTSSHLLL